MPPESYRRSINPDQYSHYRGSNPSFVIYSVVIGVVTAMRLCGCTAMRRYGCAALRLYGFAALQLYGVAVLRPSGYLPRLSSHLIFRDGSHRGYGGGWNPGRTGQSAKRLNAQNPAYPYSRRAA